MWLYITFEKKSRLENAQQKKGVFLFRGGKLHMFEQIFPCRSILSIHLQIIGKWGFNHILATTQFVPYFRQSITKIAS